MTKMVFRKIILMRSWKMDENGETLESESFLRGPRGVTRACAETVASERGWGTRGNSGAPLARWSDQLGDRGSWAVSDLATVHGNRKYRINNTLDVSEEVSVGPVLFKVRKSWSGVWISSERSRLEIEEVRPMLRVGLWRTPALVGVRGHLQIKGNSWSQSSVPEADEKRVSRRECSVLWRTSEQVGGRPVRSHRIEQEESGDHRQRSVSRGVR